MFGIKRSNIDLDKNADIATKSSDSNTQNDQENNYQNNKYIFYQEKTKFTSQLEVYLLLIDYNKKIPIIFDIELTFKELKQEIIKNLKGHPEFKDIKKLIPVDLYKTNNNNKTSFLEKENEKVKKYVHSGDILYCSLYTDEFWIKTYYNLRSYKFEKIIKMEYKLKKKMKYKKFKLMLMKGGIQYFIDQIKNTDYCDFNYYLKNFEFRIKKHNMITIHNKYNKQKNKMPIDKIINYSSEIIVKINFGIFEKLVHENIKSTKIENNNFLRINEYSDLSFEDLMTDTKYLPEFNSIKEITDDFLINQNNINNPYFLFFSKKKPKFQKNKNLSSKKNFNLIEEPKLIEEIKEVDEEKDNNIKQLNIINEELIENKKSITSRNKINHMNNNIVEEENINDKINDIKNIYIENKSIKKKKERVDKIKNMIIISKQVLKEEKVKKRFKKLITHNDFNKVNVLSKGMTKGNKKLSSSNKNVVISDYNINKILDKNDDEFIRKKREGSIETYNDYYINIDTEIKPNSLNENKGFLIFGDNKKSSKEGLDELLLDDEQEDLVSKDKYKTTISTKKTKELKGNLNIATTDPYMDEGTNSQVEEDNKSDLNTQQLPKTRKFDKLATVKYNTKHAFLSAFKNRNRNINICDSLKSTFESETFIIHIQNKFNNFCNKDTLEKIKMPQRKELEFLDKGHNLLINQKKNRLNLSITIASGFHVHIFLVLITILFVLYILFMNFDILSIDIGL